MGFLRHHMVPETRLLFSNTPNYGILISIFITLISIKSQIHNHHQSRTIACFFVVSPIISLTLVIITVFNVLFSSFYRYNFIVVIYNTRWLISLVIHSELITPCGYPDPRYAYLHTHLL